MRFSIAFLILFFAVSSVFATTPQVKVNILWEYNNFTLPVTIYEVKGNPRLWEFKSVPTLKNAPVSERIENSVLLMSPGQKKRFALVVQNLTDKPIFFFAAPHVAHPVEHSLGFKFKCLCINHSFQVNPNETWYRIVEFRLFDEFIGKNLTITHSIIGIDKKRAEAFSKVPVLPDL